jgi:hypothetical protein
LFLIIVNALGHPKGYERLTFNFLCGYNHVFFPNLIKLSNRQSLYMGRGNFGERKIVIDQVGGPPVGLAIGV